MKRRQIVALSAGLVSGGLLWMIFKKLRQSHRSGLIKMEELLEKTMSQGFNKREFNAVLSQLTAKLNQQIIQLLGDNQTFIRGSCCTEIIDSQSTGFYCQDCQQTGTNTQQVVYCHDCFKNSHHQGHRFVQVSLQNQSIPCKCGDHNFIKQAGNCSNHSDLSEEHLEAITRLFESNGELIEAWKSLWKGIFLLVLWQLESVKKMNLGSEMRGNISSVFESLLLEIIAQTSRNQVFTVLFAELLAEKIYSQEQLVLLRQAVNSVSSKNGTNTQNQQASNSVSTSRDFKSPTIRVLLHSCTSIEDFQFLSLNQRAIKTCECSFIEDILRFTSELKPNTNSLVFSVLRQFSQIPKFKKIAGFACVKLLLFLDTAQKNQVKKSAFTTVERLSCPCEFDQELSANWKYINSYFTILNRSIEQLSIQVRNDTLVDVTQVLQCLETLTNQQNVNTLVILASNGVFIKEIMKTLAKIEKRGTQAMYSQSGILLQKSQISICQAALQKIIHQEIRDVTLLGIYPETAMKLHSNSSSNNLKSMENFNPKMKSKEILKQLFNEWHCNYEAVQFDKKSISNVSSSKQDFLSFSCLIGLLVYSVALKKFNKELEINWSRQYIVKVLLKNLFNISQKEGKQSQQNQSKVQLVSQEDALESISSLLMELDHSISHNPYCIFNRESAVGILRLIFQTFPLTDEVSYDRNLALLVLKNQWSHHCSDVIALVRQFSLALTKNSLIRTFAAQLLRVSKDICTYKQNEKLKQNNNANKDVQITQNNAAMQSASENIILSFLLSSPIQYLKLNFLPSQSQTLKSVESLDVHLRSALCLQVVQYFHAYKNEVTLSLFRIDYQYFFEPFSAHNLDHESVLLTFSKFNLSKKVFELKEEFKQIGSNLTLLNGLPQFSEYSEKQVKAIMDFDVLFVEKEFNFLKVSVIEGVEYMLSYLPTLNITIFTELICCEVFTQSVEMVKDFPPNSLLFVTLLQYTVYFVKAAKDTPQLFKDIEYQDGKQQVKIDGKGLYKQLYSTYIQSRMLNTAFSALLAMNDTKHLTAGLKKLLEMVAELVHAEEGAEKASMIGKENMTADELEKVKEEERKRKMLEAKNKQQALLAKFAQQRKVFQHTQEHEGKGVGQGEKQSNDQNGSKSEGEKEQNSQNAEAADVAATAAELVLPATTNTDDSSSQNQSDFPVGPLELRKASSIPADAVFNKNESGEQEILICSMCSEVIKSSEKYGCPVYIKQCKQLISEGNEYFINVNSCGHTFHQACWSKYTSQDKKQTDQDILRYRNDSETHCSLCKRLANSFLVRVETEQQNSKEEGLVNGPVLSEQLATEEILQAYQAGSQGRSKNVVDQEEEQKNDRNAKNQGDNTFAAGITDNEGTNNDSFIRSSIADYLLCLSVANEDSDKLLIDDIETNALIRLIVLPLIRCTITGIKPFVQSYLPVWSQLMEQVRVHYLKHLQTTPSVVDNTNASNLLARSEYVLKLKEAIKRLKTKESQFALNIAVNACLSEKQPGLNEMLAIFFEFINEEYKQTIAQQQQSNNSNNGKLVQQPVGLETILESVFQPSKPIIQIFLTFCCLQGFIDFKKFKEYFTDSVEQSSGKIATPKEFLSVLESVIPNCNLKEMFQVNQSNQTTSSLKYSLSAQSSVIQVPPLVNLFTKLPNDFETFKRILSGCGCVKCGRTAFTVNSSQPAVTYSCGVSICLICGVSLCKIICQKDYQNQKQITKGNLSEHAQAAHGGCSIFMDLLVANVTYVHYPKNLVQGSIYSSKYGEIVNQHSLNWNQYFIDRTAANKIESAVALNQIPEEIFKVLNGYNNNFLQYKDSLL